LNTHLESRAAKVLVFQQLKMELPELFAESGILESRISSFTIIQPNPKKTPQKAHKEAVSKLFFRTQTTQNAQINAILSNLNSTDNILVYKSYLRKFVLFVLFACF